MTKYRYTDINGTRLTVAEGLIGLVAEGEGTIYTHAPTGEEAVKLARAVLAAAGDTGHRVISEASLDSMIDAFAKDAAKSMRSRAYEAAYNAPGTPHKPTEAIRGLPLLPGEPDTDSEATNSGAGGVSHEEAVHLLRRADPAPPSLCAAPCPRGHTHACARSPKHCGPHRDVKQKGTESCSWSEGEPLDEDFDAGWAAGHAHARADSDRIADLERVAGTHDEMVENLGDQVHELIAEMSQARAAIRGLESGRVAPRRAVKITPDSDH